jgi:D-ribose pyranose/furanose isomerase RbsD
MRIKKIFLFLLVSGLLACNSQTRKLPEQSSVSWEKQFDEQLSLIGHRNWIMVVDKAFPQQPGMQTINTGENLLPVLEKVLQKIQSSAHVKPVVFNDAELHYINDSLAKGAENFKMQLKKVLNGIAAEPILHDSVFVQMSSAAKLFTITVLKTEEVIPYSSVFIQLDCGYWDAHQEKRLRQLMKKEDD